MKKLNNRVFITHYHYKVGGVTTVVNNFIDLFSDIFEIHLVCNGDFSGINSSFSEKIYFHTINEIGYNDKIDLGIVDKIVGKIDKCFKQFRFKEDDIFIFHNYSIGKNPALTKFVVEFSKTIKNKIFLFIHDFAEAGRWKNLNYLYKTIGCFFYPQRFNVSYVVINKHDFNILKRFFANLYYLPNFSFPHIEKSNFNFTLSMIAKKEGFVFDDSLPVFLYPVRAMRRKNIFEAMLLSKIYPANLVITLNSESEIENKYIELLKKEYVEFNGIFAVGKKYEIFLDIAYKEADLVLSTSIQEGFGYTFLDALSREKKILARKIFALDEFKFNCINKYSNIKVNINSFDEIVGNIELELLDFSNLKKKALKLLNKADINEYSFLGVEKQIKVLKNYQKYVENYGEIYNKIKESMQGHNNVYEKCIEHLSPEKYYHEFLNILDLVEEKKDYLEEVLTSKLLLNDFFSLDYLKPVLTY